MTQRTHMPVKHIVIIGGGFAGLNLIKRLANDQRFQITLVDQNNYHFFPPLLYQVAMAFIEPSNISYPYRKLFQYKTNLRFHLGCFVRVNGDNTVQTESGTLPFDYLVIAHGTESNYFGMENVRKNSWPLKTINDATNLRNHLLLNIEKAIQSTNPDERRKLLNVVIAGGGPTGVEIAGMMAEMVHKIGPKEYPEIKAGTFKIYLVEAAPVLLGPMSAKSQEEARKVLQHLGIIIKLNTALKDYSEGSVLLSNGEVIPTDALLWTSGVIGREVPGLPSEVIGRSRRVLVDQYNRVNTLQNIFAIGDISLNLHDERFPKGHPQLAQVAIQQGKLLAENFKRLEENKPLKPFAYDDKGSMAIISKFKAVVDLPKMFIRGFLAWMIWLFIHLIPIAGFRNKVKLAFSWAWSFITDDPALRLVIRPNPDELPNRKNISRPETRTPAATQNVQRV